MDPLLLIRSLWPGSRASSMLEHSRPRYSPSGGGLVDRNLDTAVDLSRKSAPSEMEPEEPEDSEDEAPLDLKVRSVNMGRGHESPLSTNNNNNNNSTASPLQRAEFLRLAEMYSTGSSTSSSTGKDSQRSEHHRLHSHQEQHSSVVAARVSRESSQERDNSTSRCQYCGDETLSPEFIPSDHGEALCQRGSLACSLCPKTFTQWNQLHEHKKSHHQKLKQRHYPCQSCGKVFTSASNRNMHQRIHKGVRPFQCTPCGVYFRQKAHLQKHQKTQGHLQASELKEKNSRLLGDSSASSVALPPPPPENGGAPVEEEESGEDSELISSSSSASPSNSLDSADAPHSRPDSSTNSGQNKRSSPKRKQLCPKRTPDEHTGGSSSLLPSLSPEVLLENKIRSLVHYNESTHGYECLECSFFSHELSTLKTHVTSHHLRWEDEESFKCRDCVISFNREFNLRIHNKKHESESGALACDVCDAVFKVPHFLLKHMEKAHLACASCGCIQDDKETLERHFRDCSSFEEGFYEEEEEMEEDISVLDEDDSSPTSAAALLPPPSLTSTPNMSKENRDAKKRKVDSLAESIRLKQEQQRGVLSADHHHSNKCPPPKQPFLSPILGRKTDMSNIRALLSRPPDPPSGLNALMNHITSKIGPVPKGLLLRENNNLPLKPHSSSSNNNNNSPPVSPPPPNTTTISGSMSLKLVKGHPNHHHIHHHLSEDNNNMGLDLTVGRRHRSDSLSEEEDRNAPHHPLPFPSHLNTFSFFGLPPPGADPAFAENLLKLAGLPGTHPLHHPHHSIRGGGSNLNVPPTSSSSLSNSSSSSYHIISAALGSSSLPTVFPGLPPNLIPQQNPIHPSSSLPPRRPPSAALSDKEVTGNIPGGSRSGLEARSLSSSSPSTSSAASSSSNSSKPFRCTFCRKEFGHLSSLDSHMEHMHSGESKHTCETCGKSFSSKSNLTAHKKIHSGERPFECMVCHKRFRQKAHLQKHETTHSSATPYKCSICDKAFGHPSNLNTHMATHSNIRPYSCSECGKSYKDSASFKRHRASHSGGSAHGGGSSSPPPPPSNSSSSEAAKPHCSSCSESFMDLSSLRNHIEAAHPGVMDSLDSVGEDEEEEEESPSACNNPSSAGGDSSGYSSFESSHTSSNPDNKSTERNE